MSGIPPVDVGKRNSLLAKLALMGMRLNSDGTFEFDFDDNKPRYVSLEDFFDGAADNWTDFAVNVPDHPGNKVIYEMLKSVRTDEGVFDVLVGVVDAEGYQGDVSPYWWVYSDHVVLISSLPEADIVDRLEPEGPDDEDIYPRKSDRIVNWFGDIFPDEVVKVPSSEMNTQCGLSQLPPDNNAYYLWWD